MVEAAEEVKRAKGSKGMIRKKVLITGAYGMLGVDLISVLSHAYDVICTDIAKNKNPVHKRDVFIKCDIRDRQSAIDTVVKSKADVVLHTAAWTDVDGCELDKENAMKINAEGTHNIALGCKESKAVMFYISSDFVFDGNKNGPYKEDDRTNPLNAYGLSKLKGEEAIRKELDRYFIVRASWLFGKNGKNFVDIILDKAGQKKALKIVMDQFGSPTFTKDISRALERMVSLALKNKNLSGVYHFANGGSCSWFKYAEQILKIAGKGKAKLLPITSAELDRPAIRPGMSILDTTKYSQLCKETPRKWESALRYYLINEVKIPERNYVQGFEK